MSESKLQVKVVGEWSEEPLEEGHPMEFEDKWGKVNAPGHSIKLSEFTIPGLQAHSNFTIEFWAKSSKSALLGIPLQCESWTHFALTCSVSKGPRLYINTTKSPLPNKAQIKLT